MKISPAWLALGLLTAAPLDAALTGVLRIAGNPELGARVARWSEAFQRVNPNVRVEVHLTGSDTGVAALYTGQADLALLGRSLTPSEIQAFEWIHRYRPTEVEILTGSLDRPGRSPALVLFVHRDNPLRSLTLAQVEAVFGTEHRRAPANIRTWDQLGLTGEWAGRALRLYGPDAMSGTGRFFRHAVLADSRMMNWAQLTEFADSPGIATPDAAKKILAALADDRFGLAVASLGPADERVRPIALASAPGSAPVAATRATLVARDYLLTRAVTACCNRPPGNPPEPLVRAFLRYVLSPEGQREQDDGYLPLAAEAAARQLAQLD